MPLLDDGKEWDLFHGDCIPHMLRDMPEESVDCSVYSPPFPAIFAYHDSVSDIGNVDAMGGEAAVHLSYMYNGLYRVLKPGRVAIVHVAQIPRMKRSGTVGLCDFRGTNIRLAERAGLVFEYDWMVRKNPQSQALRTRSRELQFAGLESDRAASRGTLQDYLLKFRKPGVNRVPVRDWAQEYDVDGEPSGSRTVLYETQVSRNDWIKFAEGCWDDIHETDTLNTAAAKSEDDTRHICVAKGSLVLTSCGYMPIESVNVGDEVLTHRGRWKKVLAKQCNGIRETIRIDAQGVPGLMVTHDHLVWSRPNIGKGRWPSSKGGVSNPKLSAMKSSPEWKEASELNGRYINLPLPPIENSEWDENEWWIAGRWLGDGHWDSCARPALHISCGRHEVDYLKDRLGSYAGGIHDTGTSVQIRIKDADGRLRRLISKLGKGASGKKVPREALSLEKEIAKSFLNGYLSADGHYLEQYDRITASSVSRPLMLGISMIVQRVHGVPCSVFAGRKAGVCTIQGRTVNTKDEWILSASLSNKKSQGFVSSDGAWKRVRKLKDSGLLEVWDLQIEDDESFVVEGCAVHNCPLQLEVIRRCVLLYSNPGEIVFSPFAGIGSEGFVSLGGKSPKTGVSIHDPRRFYGCELKDEYYEQAKKNLASACANRASAKAMSLFDEDEGL